MDDIIRHIIVGFASVMIMFFVTKKSMKSEITINSDGNFIHKFPPFYLYLGLGMTVLFVVFLVLIPLNGNENIAATILLFLIFGLGGIFLVLLQSNYYFLVNKDYIQSSTIWKKVTKLPWNEIEEIEYKKGMGKLIITGKRNEKIIAHQQILGFYQVLEWIEKKKGISKEELGIK